MPLYKVWPLYQPSALYFDFSARGTYSEYNKLTSLNLSWTYWWPAGTKPPSCISPRQPTIYVLNTSSLCNRRQIPLTMTSSVYSYVDTEAKKISMEWRKKENEKNERKKKENWKKKSSKKETKASFWGCFRTEYTTHFHKLFLFTK